MQEYGLITKTDAQTLAKTIDLVCENFLDGDIYTTEIGVRDGKTSRGIHSYILSKGRQNTHTGIDNNHDMETKPPFPGCDLIIGNSMEVFNEIPDESQHMIFIDGCHNLPMTMIDFLMYAPKVKEDGFICFHDCGVQIPQFKDYQGMGSRLNPDMFISCRKAVTRLGLLNNSYKGWKLIFDEYDTSYDTGGIVVVQKII